uniref:ADP-ribosylhydrolase ARH3 n=1 Tax=Plectus sambesii TaxID=2011161 RepID=A0A914UWT1_9BILA
FMLGRGRHFVHRAAHRLYSMACDRAFIDRAKGCLYGQAVGDSLGCRYEFKLADEVKETIVADRDANGFLPIKGGGVFEFECGQVTDDTEMAMAIVRSVLRNGRYDDADVACSFAHWRFTNPPDIGNTTATALNLSSGADLEGMELSDLESENWFEKISEKQKAAAWKVIMNNAESSCKESLSNGCLMRISPIAIAAANTDTERLLDVAACNCRLTNPNDITVDGVQCYVAALKTLLDTANTELAYSAAVECAKTPTIQSILQVAREKPIPVALNNRPPTNGDRGAIGYIGVALQGAFFELLHAESFEHGLIRTIERGGDTDTNGCISGALLGKPTPLHSSHAFYTTILVNSN